MTESEAAKEGVVFPEPWVFSMRDIVLFALMAVLLIREGSEIYFDQQQAAQTVIEPAIAAVDIGVVYKALQTHFIEAGQTKERADLNVILLLPTIDETIETLQASGDYAHIFKMDTAVPPGVIDISSAIVEATLRQASATRDTNRTAYVQN